MKRLLLCGLLVASFAVASLVPLDRVRITADLLNRGEWILFNHAWGAATDAAPRPLYGVAYRVVFPILDADGDLVTAAGSLDSECSLDGGTFADCTNEATEIATSSGMYYLDLTAANMTARVVAIIVKSSGGKTTPITLYPELILVRCVVGSGSTTTSIVTSSLLPAAAVTDQFKGRIVIFEAETTTTNLRGQATDITSSTSGGVLTVSALSTAPVSGDRCMIQ